MNGIKARLWHAGQPNPNAICSNCLEKGHHKSSCSNPIKCKSCLQFRHTQDVCNTPLVEGQDEAPEAEAEDHGSQAESEPEPESAAEEEHDAETEINVLTASLDVHGGSQSEADDGGERVDNEESDLSVVSPKMSTRDTKRKQKSKSPNRVRRSKQRKK